MNRLVLIGNGFDMAHGLKTSYMDFINWYWEQKMEALMTEYTRISEDCLCKMEIINTMRGSSWYGIVRPLWNVIIKEWKAYPLDIIQDFKEDTKNFSVTYSKFFETILHSIETKGWVDIENDYYQLLKKCTEDADCGYSIKELNDQLYYLQSMLVKYLRTLKIPEAISTILEAIKENIRIDDLSTEGKALAKKLDDSIVFDDNSFDDNRYMAEHSSGLPPEHTMLLSFNYTRMAKIYEQYDGLILNYIHGDLKHPENIIFGYGDEWDDDFGKLKKLNDNEYLRNIKSYRYLESDNYRRVMDFVESDYFQISIMGHSCGTSDGTLLRKLFEHPKCVSIKPYLYVNEKGEDNYFDLSCNISRHFSDPSQMRNKVVEKPNCIELPKNKMEN